MTIEPAILSGAEQIIRRCLDLKPGQEFVIFVDETTVDVGIVIAEEEILCVKNGRRS